jgi:hypothetical protein
MNKEQKDFCLATDIQNTSVRVGDKIVAVK